MINCPWILSAAKRLFSLRLLAVVSVLALHLTMWGLDIESLYHEFSGSDKARKAAIINIISQTLYDAEITDSLYQCDKSTSPDVMDSFIHYLMAEHYNSLEQYEKSLDEGNKARAIYDGCMKGLAGFCRANISPEHLKGFMTAPWASCTEEKLKWGKVSIDSLLEGIDLLAAAV